MRVSARPAKLLCAAVMALACTCLASCVTFALHPLYGDADSVFEPDLLGTWNDPTRASDHGAYTFEKRQGNVYRAIATDPDSDPPEDYIFDVHLVRLNGQLFFDAVQTGLRVKGQKTDMGMVIPSHLIGRLSLTADTLRLDLLDDSWLKQSPQSGKSAVPFEVLGEVVVLTASTSELQKFVAAHANDNAVFPVNSSVLHRAK